MLERGRPKELIAKKTADAKTLHSFAFQGTLATCRREIIDIYQKYQNYLFKLVV